MKNLLTTLTLATCAAIVLPACSSTGWGQKSEGGSTHTMTGGAEAAPTSEATPQPARTRGQSDTGTQGGTQGGMPSDSQGGTSSGTSSSTGDMSTGGAEAAPTVEGTEGNATGGSTSGTSGADTGTGGAAGAR